MDQRFMFQGSYKMQLACYLVFACSGLCIYRPSLASQNVVSFLGLPPRIADAANYATSAKAALGKTLFFDKHLSSSGTISCSSCHQPNHAFSDGRPLAKGVKGQLGTRNTPSLLDAAYYTTFFWDGRRNSLETQALDPFVNPREQGLKNLKSLLTRLRKNPDYETRFKVVFGHSGSAISAAHVGSAIACYERTLAMGNSPFDRYFYNHEKSSLSPAAIRGFNLFKGRAHCTACHKIGKTYALFTDNKFHSLGIGLARIQKRLATLTTRLVLARKRGAKLDTTVLDDRDIAALGRFVVTLDPRDIGKFKTPSLRNVALSAPYMHNGSVKTLKEAIEREIYYRSAKAGRPLILTPIEKSDLLAFLKSLTSTNAILTNKRIRENRISQH